MSVEEHDEADIASAAVAFAMRWSSLTEDGKNENCGVELAPDSAPNASRHFRTQYRDKNEHREVSQQAPGAVAMFPTPLLSRRPDSLYDIEEPTTSNNNLTHFSNSSDDHYVPHASSVQDPPLVHATPARICMTI